MCVEIHLRCSLASVTLPASSLNLFQAVVVIRIYKQHRQTVSALVLIILE